MRLIGLTVLLFVVFSFTAQAGEKKSKEYADKGTENLSLNGLWQFSNDSTLALNQVWHKADFKSNKWNNLTVPGNWDTENDYASFVGTGYYRKEFKIPSDWEGSVIRLCFDAVYHTSEVWMNGQYLGKHVGGYTPFEFDITKVIKPGKTNTIALSANNEYQRGAWWHWGGISNKFLPNQI
jgi:beta-galactosidase